MRSEPDAGPAEPVAGTRTWSAVHHVVGPPDGAPLGLYVHGAGRGPLVTTPTGTRVQPVVPAGATAGFGTYCNAFPAGQWREHAQVRGVRLRIRVDAGALLTVRRSDPDGVETAGPQHLLRPGVDETVEIALGRPGSDGLLWFELRAGPSPVALTEAAWEVREPPRQGGLVIGTPTVGRVDDVAANLRRIAQAPDLLRHIDRIVVVDHAPVPIAPALTAAVGGLPDVLQVVRQPNLGGSGGYSRVMHEAVGVPGAQAVLLLDDDIVVEPAALLRAFEFARRCPGGEIVGLQMLDAARPAVLEAGAEHIVGRTFWWAPADAALPGTDVAATPVPSLLGSGRADFAGWWGALVPLDVVRAIGYAMPFFLKWDDAEYALRARAAGYRTISLHGAAVWHESWRGKDDARTWPAYFHARNRLLSALLHGSARVRTGVLLASLATEVKQLVALHAFAVERRQEGVRAVLAGPAALESGGAQDLARLAALSARLPRIDAAEAEAVPERATRTATSAPTGGRLAAWTAVVVLRHLLAPVRGGATRLAPGRGTWWALAWFDDVLTPTADGSGYFRLVRSRRGFRRALATSVALHLRLWWAWPGLGRRYRAAASALAAPEAWARRFASER